MVVVPIYRCSACSGPGRLFRFISEHDGSILMVWTCDGCIEKYEAHLASVRPVFDAMLAAGVPKDKANDVMTFLLEQFPGPD